jgi:hypothetical protein
MAGFFNDAMTQEYFRIEGFKPTLNLREVNHNELNKILSYTKGKIFNYSDLQKLAAVLWDNRDTIGFNIEDFVINELDVVGKTIKKQRLTGSFHFGGFFIKNANFDYEPSMDNFISGNELKLFFDEISELGMIPGRADTVLKNPTWGDLLDLGWSRNCAINRQFNWYEVRIDPMKDSTSGQTIPVCVSYIEFVP